MSKAEFIKEFKENVLIILEDYEQYFGDAPTLQDLQENDLEFEKVGQHILIMYGVTAYNGFTIVPVKNPKYFTWIRVCSDSKFKRAIRNYWKRNQKILEANLNINKGTAMISELLGRELTEEQVTAIHSIFYPKTLRL